MKRIHIAVVGCRDFPRTERVRALVRLFRAGPVTLVSGHGGNVDLAAEKEADELPKIPKRIFPADWKKYGPKAGPIRNAEIAAACDVMIAFWDFKSKGTQSAIDNATKLNKPVLIIGTEHGMEDEQLEHFYKKAVHYGVLFMETGVNYT